MKSAQEAVLKAVENNREQIINTLRDLTRFPSLAGHEAGAQQYCADLMAGMGLAVDMWIPQPGDMSINPHFLAMREDYEGSPDVVGELKGLGGGKSMMVNGHIDVVPAGDNDWDDDPWSGKYQDGKISGRGSSDMKAGITAGLMAVKSIIDADIKLKGDVYVATTIGEETGGAGTLSMISRGYKADGAIVPEPSDLKVCPVSIGAMWFRVIVRGLATHSATAHLGINAISKAALIIQAIDQYNEARRLRPRHELYNDKPHPFNINMGVIAGGQIPSSVPDEIIIEARMAVSPEEEISQARLELEEAVGTAAAADPWLREHQPEIQWYGFCLCSGAIEKEHPVIQSLAAGFEAVTGTGPVLSGTPWGTDAGAMIRYGQIPTVVFGPGPDNTAHKANEYVEVEKLITTTKIIALTLLNWCGTSE